jgi:hypothetical protein
VNAPTRPPRAGSPQITQIDTDHPTRVLAWEIPIPPHAHAVIKKTCRRHRGLLSVCCKTESTATLAATSTSPHLFPDEPNVRTVERFAHPSAGFGISNFEFRICHPPTQGKQPIDSSTPPAASLGMTPSSRYRPCVPTEPPQSATPTEQTERHFKLSSRPRERSERVKGSIRLAELAQDKPVGLFLGARPMRHPPAFASSIGFRLRGDSYFDALPVRSHP